jgi:hypothetical protein
MKNRPGLAKGKGNAKGGKKAHASSDDGHAEEEEEMAM